MCHEHALAPVVLVRSLPDAVVSLRDHLRRESVASPIFFAEPHHAALDDATLEAMIVRLALPWYINFYMGWRQAPNALFVSYEDFLDAPADLVRRVLAFAAAGASDAEIAAALRAGRAQRRSQDQRRRPRPRRKPARAGRQRPLGVARLLSRSGRRPLHPEDPRRSGRNPRLPSRRISDCALATPYGRQPGAQAAKTQRFVARRVLPIALAATGLFLLDLAERPPPGWRPPARVRRRRRRAARRGRARRSPYAASLPAAGVQAVASSGPRPPHAARTCRQLKSQVCRCDPEAMGRASFWFAAPRTERDRGHPLPRRQASPTSDKAVIRKACGDRGVAGSTSCAPDAEPPAIGSSRVRDETASTASPTRLRGLVPDPARGAVCACSRGRGTTPGLRQARDDRLCARAVAATWRAGVGGGAARRAWERRSH